MAASIRKNFVFNFAKLLAAAGIDQKQVSIDLGYSESRISKWVHGVNFPEEKAFDRIREVYGWTFDRLVRDPPLEIVPMSKDEVLALAVRIVNDAGMDVVKRKH